MARRRRTTENDRKGNPIVWEALEYVRRDDRSPKQVAGYMKRELYYIHTAEKKNG